MLDLVIPHSLSASSERPGSPTLNLHDGHSASPHDLEGSDKEARQFTPLLNYSKHYPHIVSSPSYPTMAAYGQTQYSTGIQQAAAYTGYPPPGQAYGIPSYSTTGLYQSSNGLTSSPGFSSVHQEYPSYPGFTQSQYSQFYNPSYNSPYISTNSISPSAISTAAYSVQELSHNITNQSPESLSGECNTHIGPSTPVKDGESDRHQRGSDGKLRGRSKRSNDPSPSIDNEIERVFVWDLDETIIIFHSLLTGTFATRYGKDDIVKVDSENKLNFNWEKSRVKEMYADSDRKMVEVRTDIIELHAQQDRGLTQVRRKLDTEVAGLKTMLESHKLDTIKYLAGSVFTCLTVLLGFFRIWM